MSSTESQRLGRMGEEAVLSRYARAGFTLVGRNVRQFPNEIDLILESDTHLVFVEVKTRHMVFGVRSRYGRPADAVTPTPTCGSIPRGFSPASTSRRCTSPV